jgi:uncharacterized protein DUF6881
MKRSAMPAHHWKVVWHHASPDDPVLLYHDVGGGLWELRKVEVYADGRMDVADAESQTGTTWLSDQALMPLQEIRAQREFESEAVSATEFDAIWNAAMRQRSAG